MSGDRANRGGAHRTARMIAHHCVRLKRTERLGIYAESLTGIMGIARVSLREPVGGGSRNEA